MTDVEKNFSESDHPRDSAGRFSTSEGLVSVGKSLLNLTGLDLNKSSGEVYRYKHSGPAINQQLRQAKGKTGEYDNFIGLTVNALDPLIKSARLLQDTTVYRGFSGAFTRAMGDLLKVGMEFVDHGYISTSWDDYTARTFADEHASLGAGLLAKIDLPAGSRAFDIDSFFSKYPAFDDNPMGDEAEILLPRSSRFRVAEYSPKSRHLRLELK